MRRNQPSVPVSPEIEKVIEDGQRLICYIARDGNIELDPSLIEVIINAKYKLAENSWSQEDEQEFLISYDKLSQSVYPVTVESINAIVPKTSNSKPTKTKADKAVAWYRRGTMFALLMLITTQVYWFFGNELRANLQDIFEQREQLQTQLLEKELAPQQQAALTASLKIDNQKLDANYKMLMLWNRIWSFGGRFDDSLPRHFQTEYQMQKRALEQSLPSSQEQLNALELKRSLHQVRILFFENILSADFMLETLQNYILPLMYGLLGAFIYVLRDLLRAIKGLTYTFDNEIRYRLRLTLGALGGMIIGWFLKAEDSGAMASMSPMAMAFLMGYNVDVLFSIMDKIIDNIKRNLDREESKTASKTA